MEPFGKPSTVIAIALATFALSSASLAQAQSSPPANEVEVLKAVVGSLEAKDKLDLVFIVDVGGELAGKSSHVTLQLVQSVLEHVMVGAWRTRLALVTFDLEPRALIDDLRQGRQSKCAFLAGLQKVLSDAPTPNGYRDTSGALDATRHVLLTSRPEASKVALLLTDGRSNVGPAPLSSALALRALRWEEPLKGRKGPVTLYTLGLGEAYVPELRALASHSNSTVYVPTSSRLSALASAIRTDSVEDRFQVVEDSCADQCHSDAVCTCGQRTGQFQCLCKGGFSGDGLTCTACPRDTYREGLTPGPCLPCPLDSSTPTPGAASPSQCQCLPPLYRDSPDLPCQLRTCPTLPIIPGGERFEVEGAMRGTMAYTGRPCGNRAGSTCHLRCVPGFRLKGLPGLVCQPDGSWLGDTPICQAVDCGRLEEHGEEVTSGLVDYVNGSTGYGNTVITSCHPGFTLYGDASRTCTGAGKWSGTPAQCIDTLCPALSSPPGGRLEPQTCTEASQMAGTTCSVLCNHGYQLLGPPRRHCFRGGNWDNTATTRCIDVERPNITCPPDVITTVTQANFALVHWNRDAPTISDNSGESTDLTVLGLVTSPAELSVGVYSLKYVASDRAGNRNTCQRTITVKEHVMQVVGCPDNITLDDVMEDMSPITWSMPTFRTPDDVTVNSTCSVASDALFPVGVTRVECSPLNIVQKAETCVFFVLIKAVPCALTTPAVHADLDCYTTTDSREKCDVKCGEGFDFTTSSYSSLECDVSKQWLPQPIEQHLRCGSVRYPRQVTSKGEMEYFYLGADCDQHKGDLEQKIHVFFLDHIQDICKNCTLQNVTVVCNVAARLRREVILPARSLHRMKPPVFDKKKTPVLDEKATPEQDKEDPVQDKKDPPGDEDWPRDLGMIYPEDPAPVDKSGGVVNEKRVGKPEFRSATLKEVHKGKKDPPVKFFNPFARDVPTPPAPLHPPPPPPPAPALAARTASNESTAFTAEDTALTSGTQTTSKGGLIEDKNSTPIDERTASKLSPSTLKVLEETQMTPENLPDVQNTGSGGKPTPFTQPEMTTLPPTQDPKTGKKYHDVTSHPPPSGRIGSPLSRDQLVPVLDNKALDFHDVSSGDGSTTAEPRTTNPPVQSARIAPGGSGSRKGNKAVAVTFIVAAETAETSSAGQDQQEAEKAISDVIRLLPVRVAKQSIYVEHDVSGMGVLMPTPSGGPSFQRPGLAACDAGEVTRSQPHRCVKCPGGSYMSGGRCELCPRGQFQEEEGQLSCIPCPPGHTTPRPGALHQYQCLEACNEGSSSPTGLAPCQPCGRGFYQPLPSQVTCLPCPHGTSTSSTGSPHLSQCQETCPAGHFSSDGLMPCELCPLNTYQPSEGARDCLLCPYGTGTLHSGATAQKECVAYDVCATHECKHDASCFPGGRGSYSCLCKVGFRGQACEEDIDDCLPSPCRHQGTCIDQLAGFRCVCDEGFTGSLCEFDVDECSSSPCANGGSCLNVPGSYQCYCLHGYQGRHCEDKVDAQPHCVHGIVNGSSCSCNPGFSGDLCEMKFDLCSSFPCRNGGDCHADGEGFCCSCPAGWTGALCEVLVDACASTPCAGGGRCVSDRGSHLCLCPGGLTGPFCTVEAPSTFDLVFPRLHSGDYVTVQRELLPALPEVLVCVWLRPRKQYLHGTVFSYVATQGRNRSFSEVLSLRRMDNLVVTVASVSMATGVTVTSGMWSHVCVTWSNTRGRWGIYVNGTERAGHDGLAVGYVIPSGGSLVLGQRQVFSEGMLSAREGYVGEISHFNVFRSLPSLSYLRHLASQDHCSDTYGDVIPWSAVIGRLHGNVELRNQSLCLDTDECQGEPCPTNTRCHDLRDSYRCQGCVYGYHGDTCLEPDDECLLGVCQNGATCMDGPLPHDYLCLCQEGWEGRHCDVTVDSCRSQPCLNNGTCVAMADHFRCVCPRPEMGPNCQAEKITCSPNPCKHGGRCFLVSERSEVTARCECEPPWMGPRCEVYTRPGCDLNPCLHGGECKGVTEGDRGFTCSCPATRNVRLDASCGLQSPCVPHPCVQGRVCVHRPSYSHSCMCLPRLEGLACLLNVSTDVTPTDVTTPTVRVVLDQETLYLSLLVALLGLALLASILCVACKIRHRARQQRKEDRLLKLTELPLTPLHNPVFQESPNLDDNIYAELGDALVPYAVTYPYGSKGQGQGLERSSRSSRRSGAGFCLSHSADGSCCDEPHIPSRTDRKPLSSVVSPSSLLSEVDGYLKPTLPCGTAPMDKDASSSFHVSEDGVSLDCFDAKDALVGDSIEKFTPDSCSSPCKPSPNVEKERCLGLEVKVPKLHGYINVGPAHSPDRKSPIAVPPVEFAWNALVDSKTRTPVGVIEVKPSDFDLDDRRHVDESPGEGTPKSGLEEGGSKDDYVNTSPPIQDTYNVNVFEISPNSPRTDKDTDESDPNGEGYVPFAPATKQRKSKQSAEQEHATTARVRGPSEQAQEALQEATSESQTEDAPLLRKAEATDSGEESHRGTSIIDGVLVGSGRSSSAKDIGTSSSYEPNLERKNGEGTTDEIEMIRTGMSDKKGEVARKGECSLQQKESVHGFQEEHAVPRTKALRPAAQVSPESAFASSTIHKPADPVNVKSSSHGNPSTASTFAKQGGPFVSEQDQDPKRHGLQGQSLALAYSPVPADVQTSTPVRLPSYDSIHHGPPPPYSAHASSSTSRGWQGQAPHGYPPSLSVPTGVSSFKAPPGLKVGISSLRGRHPALPHVGSGSAHAAPRSVQSGNRAGQTYSQIEGRVRDAGQGESSSHGTPNVGPAVDLIHHLQRSTSPPALLPTRKAPPPPPPVRTSSIGLIRQHSGGVARMDEATSDRRGGQVGTSPPPPDPPNYFEVVSSLQTAGPTGGDLSND